LEGKPKIHRIIPINYAQVKIMIKYRKRYGASGKGLAGKGSAKRQGQRSNGYAISGRGENLIHIENPIRLEADKAITCGAGTRS